MELDESEIKLARLSKKGIPKLKISHQQGRQVDFQQPFVIRPFKDFQLEYDMFMVLQNMTHKVIYNKLTVHFCLLRRRETLTAFRCSKSIITNHTLTFFLIQRRQKGLKKNLLLGGYISTYYIGKKQPRRTITKCSQALTWRIEVIELERKY